MIMARHLWRILSKVPTTSSAVLSSWWTASRKEYVCLFPKWKRERHWEANTVSLAEAVCLITFERVGRSEIIL